MEQPKTKHDKRLTIVFFGLVFIFSLVFFYNIHPLVILDADDWTYVSYTRFAVPSLKYWNPARILPEISMSAVSSAAVYILLPIMRDYISALSLMYAFVLAVAITLYTGCFVRLAERMGQKRGWNILAAAIFLILHFLIFRTENSNNSYMLRSCNVTCYFYYTIPGLLNASLVMYFLSEGGIDGVFLGSRTSKKGLLIVLMYLAVFSNLFESIILAGYAGVCVLLKLFGALKEKRAVKELIKGRAVSIAVVLLWCVSAVFELLGGRAASLSHSESFGTLLGETVRRVFAISGRTNLVFLMLFAGLLVLAGVGVLLSKNRKCEKPELFAAIIFTGLVVTVFVILLGAKTQPKYIDVYRADLIFGMLFFPVLLVSMCGVYLIARFEWVKCLVPLLILLLLTEVNTPLTTFAESNMIFTPHETVAEMSRDVLEQIVAADRAGLDEAVIYVSDTTADAEDNWPQATYMGPRIVSSLLKHGIIHREMALTIVPSEEFNAKYGLDFSK